MLTEHLRTAGGAECTQIAGLRPVSASHNSTLTFPLLRCGRARQVIHGGDFVDTTGSARLEPRIWPATARLGETPYLVARVGLNRAVPLQAAGSGVEFASGGRFEACIRVRQEGRDIHILRVRRQLSDRGTGERGRDSGQTQPP